MAEVDNEPIGSEEAEQEPQDEDWEEPGHRTLCELIAVIHRYLDNRDEPPEGETEESRIAACASSAGWHAVDFRITQELRDEFEALEIRANKIMEAASAAVVHRSTETGTTPVITATVITGPKQRKLEQGHAKPLWNMMDFLQNQKDIKLPHAIVRKACAAALRMYAVSNGTTGAIRRKTIRSQLNAGTEAGIVAIQSAEKERICRKRALEAYEGGITILATMCMYQRMMYTTKGQEETQQQHEHTLPMDGEHVLRAAIQDRSSLKRKQRGRRI